MENIKVYKFHKCDMVATKENLKDTIEWYQNTYDDDKIENDDVEVIDIENTNIWSLATEEDLEKCQEEGLKNFHGDWYVLITLKEVLEEEQEYVSPYVIASTEV